ncbi:hypothetical protein LIER_38193 [Lithospermum erythrorhizon]|uniref:Uncharacterized protein n=1 Tax=Lithospermum erythrorhizon TaxID=34254 RepID=A0AAV3PY07_LITER
MVKPRSEEVLIEGGGSYLAIEKAMKKKKKRKSSPPEDDVSNMVASNADPSLLVRVPQDNRINVEGVLDEKMQKVVAEWEQNSPSLVAKAPCGGTMGANIIEVGEITPKTAYVVALYSETEAVIQRDGGDRTQSVSNSLPIPPANQSQDGDVLNNVGGGGSQTGPVLQPLAGLRGLSSDGLLDAGKGLVFKAGNSDSGSGTNAIGSNTGRPKLAGAMLQRARKALSRRSGVRLGASSGSTRLNPPNSLPIRPEPMVPMAAPSGLPEGAKAFGHNIFKCPKKAKVVNTPVIPPPVVPTRNPVVEPVPVVNPEPVIPPRVTRSKTRVKSRNNAPPKDSLPMVGNNIANGSLLEANDNVVMATSPSIKEKGLKGVDKGKAIVSQIPVVSPNPFEALNGMGGTSGTQDKDAAKIQMGDLVPSSSEKTNHNNEGGIWKHVLKKVILMGAEGLYPPLSLNADNVLECTGALWTFKPLGHPAYC